MTNRLTDEEVLAQALNKKVDNSDESATLAREDDRIKRSANEEREISRTAFERSATDNQRGTDDEVRRSMMRNMWQHNALPPLDESDKDPNFHYIWLSTTNERDTIAKRQQAGYVPVKPEEMPNLAAGTIKSGDYAGCIAANEMILCKIPMEYYLEYMKFSHHDSPLEQEQIVQDQMDQLKQAVGKNNVVESGYDGIEFNNNTGKPAFN